MIPQQTPASFNEYQIAKQIVGHIADQQIDQAVTLLHQLTKFSRKFPQQWLNCLAEALETGDFDPLSSEFINSGFLGKDGKFLIIGPYTVFRESQATTQLTAILGQAKTFEDFTFNKVFKSLSLEFGELRQQVPKILPYKLIAACGNVGGEENEAFVVANNWLIKNSVRGLSLNDISEQHRRFRDYGQHCLRRIYHPDTAEFFISALADETTANRYRSLEYQLHEFGHASGLSLEYKIQADLFTNNYWNASVEESRSDGIELEFAARELSEEEAAKIAVVNFAVRQALDAHRKGGLNRDGDVGASLLNFSFLWDSEEITIKDGKLHLRDLSNKGLLRAVKPHREWAMQITRKELSLDYPQGISRLYGSVSVHPAIEAIFQGLVVDPCKGIFKALR